MEKIFQHLILTNNKSSPHNISFTIIFSDDHYLLEHKSTMSKSGLLSLKTFYSLNHHNSGDHYNSFSSF